MLSQSAVLSLIILICVNCVSGDILFNSGWYKTRKKGEKKVVNRVASVGPDLFPNNAAYLRIGGTIPVLHKRSIHDLATLRELLIPSSGIIDIEPGAFVDLPRLAKLNLKENGIRHIRNGVFNHLNLTSLFLNKNEITLIDSGAFDDMPNLHKIKLNSNKISMWDVDWFKNTPKLSIVSMRRNLMDIIPENAFQHFPSNELRNKMKLSDLKIFLSKNRISTIHPGAFAGIEKIGHLYLDRNKFTRLNADIFLGVKFVHVLNFARNNISEVDKNVFTNIETVDLLDFRDNHKLTCIPEEVGSVVKTIKMETDRELNCSCILKLKEHSRVVTRRPCEL